MSKLQKILAILMFILMNILLLIMYLGIILSDQPLPEKVVGIFATITMHLLLLNVAALFYEDMK